MSKVRPMKATRPSDPGSDDTIEEGALGGDPTGSELLQAPGHEKPRGGSDEESRDQSTASDSEDTLTSQGVGWDTRPTKRRRRSDDAGPDPSLEGRSKEEDRVPVLNDLAQEKADEINDKRIREAIRRDKEIVGKFLPGDVEAFFPFEINGPEDRPVSSQEWLAVIKEVSWKSGEVPSPPQFRFEMDSKSVRSNEEILQEAGYDLSEALRDRQGTTIDPGSEFRPTRDLRAVLAGHPNIEELVLVIEEGMKYLCTSEPSDSERVSELQAQLSRGNHSSALENEEEILDLISKDVRHGFAVPVPRKVLLDIKGGMVQPCGIVEQFSLNADGSRKKKRRLTHDLSFGITEGYASINDRIDMERYPDMTYGWCLNQIIHFIVALRCEYPKKPIMISKFDYSDAYRRMAHHPSAAAQTILAVGELAFIYLRLVFGGSPNPAIFCLFSEALTDLANEVSCSPHFKPSEFCVPTVEAAHLIAKEYDAGEKEGHEWGEGVRPVVRVPVDHPCRKDCFIDDVVNVFLGDEDLVVRESYTVPLAVHVLSRPHAGEREPIPRRPLLAPDKLDAEGRPSEIQQVLGWEINTRRLQISLP